MKRKLEETGKKCSFKNYDIFQAKVCFSFLDLFLINQFMHYGCTLWLPKRSSSVSDASQFDNGIVVLAACD